MSIPSLFTVVLVVGGAVVATPTPTRLITVHNDQVRRDTAGNILEVADGNIIWHDGKHYLVGVRYQPCKEPDKACGLSGGNLGPPEYPSSDHDCSNNGERAPGMCCGWRNMTFASYSSCETPPPSPHTHTHRHPPTCRVWSFTCLPPPPPSLSLSLSLSYRRSSTCNTILLHH
jgi:hypothetical protein